MMAHAMTGRERQLDEMWQVFNAMGQNFEAGLIHPSNGATIWCRGRGKNGYVNDYQPERAMKALMASGLAQVREHAPDASVEEFYELTEAGRALYNEHKDLPDAERFTEAEKHFVLNDE